MDDSNIRWGQINTTQIEKSILNIIPKNTTVNKNSQWRQFQDFCAGRKYNFDKNTTISEIVGCLKDWAYNMKRKNGEDYKEAVVKTLWNGIAKMLQEKLFNEYKIKFDPFNDIEFSGARKARDSRRKELQGVPGKRKENTTAFTLEESVKMQKFWDENTPDGLQKKKIFNIFAKELAWRGNEGAFANIWYFKSEFNNFGKPTRRIEYNPIFSKTSRGGSKQCCDSKWLIPNSKNADICPVRLFQKLKEKRPKSATSERFFLTPNPNWQLTGCSSWYKNCPIGINNIRKWTKETAQNIGIDTLNHKITNHCYRSTAVTHLANANVPEQQLMKITGHTNSNSIQPYLHMQQNRHAEIVSSLRGTDAVGTELNSNLQSNFNEARNTTHPQVIYQNCTFHVQNMYTNNMP